MRNLREYLWADTASEALRLLAGRPGRSAFAAGGTTLAERQDPGLEAVVDLGRLGLDRCSAGPDLLRLGACLPLQKLADLPELRTFAGGLLAEAARRIRTDPWRRQATVAGRLLSDDPADPLRAALLVVDARVLMLRCEGGSPETGDLEPALALVPRTGTLPAPVGQATDPALVLEIQVPVPSPAWRFALESVAHSALDTPIAAIAAGLRIEAGAISAARVATAALPVPQRSPHAEAALLGRAPGPTAWEAAQAALEADIAPCDDFRASAGYRRHVARVLLARALHRASVGVGG